MKCFVEQFNAAVENPALLGLDDVMFYSVKSGAFKAVPTTGNTVRATVVGNGYFDISGSHVTTYDFVSGSPEVTLVSDGASIKCNNRDKIYNLKIPNINFESCKYLSSLAYMSIIEMRGNIEYLHGTNMPGATIAGLDVYGDINQLPTNNKQSNWLIRNTDCHSTDIGAFFSSFKDVSSSSLSVLLSGNIKITGTIEGIVSACVDAGRVNKEIKMSVYKTSVTFGGSTDISNATEVSFSILKWTDKTHIIYQCGSDADVADSSKNIQIFAKGATAEQISTWESQGNTVHVIS